MGAKPSTMDEDNEVEGGGENGEILSPFFCNCMDARKPTKRILSRPKSYSSDPSGTRAGTLAYHVDGASSPVSDSSPRDSSSDPMWWA
mmetsp:Transcript_59635/g.96552  ORF Transcript_59635/g.96552 Transcript_59635/m.96552 type:complete len:88 (-) Transcript_59635:720-983(-)